ncbi:MAG: hypothetical protein LBQ40_06370, partial [Clostridiales bacterium]|nr:hypothetical protein [Clostridiales bacterium]
MILETSDALKKIARAFYPHKLYAVGGCVRNALLGIKAADTDLCGDATPEEVFLICGGGAIKAAAVNPRIGTLKLKCGGESFEYTSFRRDNYDISGGHSPSAVVFTKSIEEDALRRDFKVNAVYYDVAADKLSDPIGGVADIKKMILTTCDKPEITLSQDGLRLMRLARLAAEYGFDIEEKTFLAAREHGRLIKNISGERIRDELIKILRSDSPAEYAEKNGASAAAERKRGPRCGLSVLSGISVTEHILPGLKTDADFDGSDGGGFCGGSLLDIIERSSKDARLAALFCRCDARQISGYMGGGGMRFSAAEIKRTKRLVAGLAFDCGGASEDGLVGFIRRNADVVCGIISLKLVTGGGADAKRLDGVYRLMKDRGAPFNIADLKIDGDDIKKLGVCGADIGEILNRVLTAVGAGEKMLTR